MIDIANKPFNNLDYIDLFCGIGGFHLALSSFGAKCVFASDIDSKARAVYKKNFGITPAGDITKIKNKEIPPHDILCAGFPCQPFSISGNQKGFNDPHGKLFFQIIRIARFHKPKILILENVKNLKTHNNCETMTEIRKQLNGIGYDVYDEVLSASDFGIPQARERLYIVAIKKSLKIKKFIFPVAICKKIQLSDILYDESAKYDVRVKRQFSINKRPLHRIGLIQVARICRGRQGERIYSPQGYSTTLSSQSGGLGGKTGMYLIDGIVRKLYPRECARLMGFPDDFIYAQEISSVYKQFGNSVVVDVLQYILIEIANQLKNL